MIDLVSEAKLVQDYFEENDWSFCFIGGLALLRWGDPRLTRAVDATLFVGFGNEERFVDALLLRFRGRLAETRSFALSRRVVLLLTPAGDGLDVSLGGFPFEEEMVVRSSKAEFAPGIELRTCSAEDLVVLKAFASRDQDWIDVRNVAIRQHGRLDWPAVYDRLTPLAEAKEEPEILTRLRAIERESVR